MRCREKHSMHSIHPLSMTPTSGPRGLTRGLAITTLALALLSAGAIQVKAQKPQPQQAGKAAPLVPMRQRAAGLYPDYDRVLDNLRHGIVEGPIPVWQTVSGAEAETAKIRRSAEAKLEEI